MENVQLNVARNVAVTLDIKIKIILFYRPIAWKCVRLHFVLNSTQKRIRFFCSDRKCFEWVAEKLHASHFLLMCVRNVLFLLNSLLHNITILFEQSYWQPIPANAHFIVVFFSYLSDSIFQLTHENQIGNQPYNCFEFASSIKEDVDRISWLNIFFSSASKKSRKCWNVSFIDLIINFSNIILNGSRRLCFFLFFFFFNQSDDSGDFFLLSK